MTTISRPTGSVWIDLGRKVVTADNLQHEDIALKRLSVSMQGADMDSFERSLSPENLLGGGSPDLEALAKAKVEMRECEVSVGPKTQARMRSLMKTGLTGLPPFVASAILSSFEGDEGLQIKLSAERAQPRTAQPSLHFENDRFQAGGIRYQDFQLENMELQLPGVGQKMGTILQGLNFEQKPTTDAVEPLKDQVVGLDDLKVGLGPQVQGAMKAALGQSFKGMGLPPGLETLLNSTLSGEHLRLSLSVKQGAESPQQTLVMPPEFERGVHLDVDRGLVEMKDVQAGALGVDNLSVELPKVRDLVANQMSLDKLFAGEKPELEGLDEVLPVKADSFKVRIGQATLDGVRERFLKSDKLKELKIKPEENGRFSFQGKAKVFWDLDFQGQGQLGSTEDGRLTVKLDDLRTPGFLGAVANKVKGPVMELLKPDVDGVEVEDTTITLDPAALLPPGLKMKLDGVTTENGEIVLISRQN